MNRNPYNQTHGDRPEPWEQSYYETGCTRPPKSYRSLIAVLLVIIIFLGGIVSAVSFLNVHLSKQVSQPPKQEDSSVSFAQVEDPVPSETADYQLTPTAPTGTETVVSINQSPQSVENIPQVGGLSLQQIYTKAIDSVVSISCVSGGRASSGTGVVLSRDGYIVTNCHVVADADTVNVLFTDQRMLPAMIVGTDVISDLAVLYVEAKDLSPAEFGDSSALRVGDTVAAIGDPLGMELRGTLTDGIVSAINRDVVTEGRTMTLIQTNAALNSGNSGGPLLNCYGQVIGINTMKIGDYMSSAGVEGLGFAIPSTTVKEIVDQLITQGYVSGRPYLGFSVQDMSTIDLLYYHLPQGVWIKAVDGDSDAAEKGLMSGDLLLSFDGVRITSADALSSLLYGYEAGDIVDIVVYRTTGQHAVQLQIGQAK